jgi:pimeloyl-ACP methyl ester carboxylesterase
MWEPQVRMLADSLRLICCDLRGFGQSPIPDGEFSYYEDIAGLFNALDIQSAWLIGASFGGSVAVDFCLAYPKKVRGLILAAPLVSGYEPADQIKEFGEREEALLAAGDLAGATELNLSMWVDGPYRSAEQVPADVRSRVAEMQLHAFNLPVPARAKVQSLDPPARHRLDEIQAPTLIIVGELDVPEVVAFSADLAEEISAAKRIVVPGVAHIVSMEAPEVFNQLVLDFITQIAENS